MEILNRYGFKNNYVVHLSVNSAENLENLIEEIQQIQEDIAEDDLDFIELEQIKNDLISAKEKFEKISQRYKF